MRTIIFGAGKRLERLLQSDLLDGYRIVAIADNDVTKHGKLFTYNDFKIPIIHPFEIKKINVECIIVSVSNKTFASSIMKQLKDMNISCGNILFYEGNKLTYRQLSDKEYIGDNINGNIFIETTYITQHDTKTGIPRVINNLYTQMIAVADNLMPIQWFGGYITSYAYKCRLEGTPFNGYEKIVNITSNDTLFIPDTSWALGENVIIDAYKKHAKIYPIIYDLIPLQIHDVFSYHASSPFKEWINTCLLYSNGIICISKTAADDVADYFSYNKIQRSQSLPLFFIHLGADIHPVCVEPRESIRDFSKRKPTFLMVGVIGPQKNHKLVLRAFKKILRSGNDKIQLLILGRDAYDDKDFKNLYYSDETLQHNVMWVQDANDGELQWAYKNCTALLFASMAEGFGLPLAEAAYFNLPLLLNDTPIFRELAGENAEYFKTNDEDSLVKAISEWVEKGFHPSSKNIRLYSWQETAKEVLAIFDGKETPYMVL